MINMILSYGIVGVVGFITGVTVQFGYLRHHGKRIVLPFISDSSRTVTVAAIGLGLLSLFTIIQVEQSNQDRERDTAAFQNCQKQFQEALAYNANITLQEKPLEMRRTRAQDKANNGLNEFVRQLITPQASPLPLLGELNKVQEEVSKEIAEIDKERAELTKTRLPYPEPSCQSDNS